ncbi:MAG: GTPase Era [Bacilli bacterium]
MKVGFCALYGLANAGKSTLLNAILGIKVQAVSDKPQTTRENVQGIYNDDDSQIVFIDTPGLHNPHKKLGQLLIRDAEQAKAGVDILIYVVDGKERVNESLCESISKVKIPVIVAFNKIDDINLDSGQFKLKAYKKLLPNAEVVEISALKKFGIDKLIEVIKSHCEEGTPFFPKDQILDHPTEFVYAEMIREKCFRMLKQEVPHAIHVKIVQQEIDQETGRKVIYADIIVEKKSEKAIVIGHQGKMISKIRHLAQHSISIFNMEPVELELYVKVVEDWRDNPRYLSEYGYKK